MRKKLKVSADEFASVLGISRRSLYNKEHGVTPWLFSELVIIEDMMKANGVAEHLIVSFDGEPYGVIIEKIA